MSLGTQPVDREIEEDATLISSLFSRLSTKATPHHTVNFQTTVKSFQGKHLRVKSGTGEESQSLIYRPSTSSVPSGYGMPDKFDYFLDLKPKIRIQIYNDFMDSRIHQCFCPKCAPRPLSKDSTAIFNIPGTNDMIIESPQSYCVPLVLSLLLANREIYNKLRPLFYGKLTALLTMKGPLQPFFPPLHTTRAVRLFPAFQQYVTKWTIELPIDTVLPKGMNTQTDWCVKTLAKEVYRFSLFLEYCKALSNLTIIIKVNDFSHAWFDAAQVDDKGQFEFEWLHRFLEFGLDDNKAVKVKIEMHLPYMKLWWKKEYQQMWVKGWNAGLMKKGMDVHELFFRDTESGANFCL